MSRGKLRKPSNSATRRLHGHETVFDKVDEERERLRILDKRGAQSDGDGLREGRRKQILLQIFATVVAIAIGACVWFFMRKSPLLSGEP